MITATYVVRKEDVLAMSMRYYATSPSMRRSRILIQALVPLWLVLVVAASYFISRNNVIFVFSMLLIAILWAGFYPRLQNWLVLRASERILNGPDYQKVFGVQTLTLSERGIASTSPLGEGTYYWPSVSSVSLTSDYLFIFLAGRQGHVVPRAQVPDAIIKDMRAFAEHMTQSGPKPQVFNSPDAEARPSVS